MSHTQIRGTILAVGTASAAILYAARERIGERTATELAIVLAGLAIVLSTQVKT